MNQKDPFFAVAGNKYKDKLLTVVNLIGDYANSMTKTWFIY